MNQEQILELLEGLDSKIWAALIAAIIAMLVAILNFVIQRKSLKLQSRQLTILENDKKAEKLRVKLNEFYNPFDLLLSKSAELYKVFRNGLPQGFRTLEHLIDEDIEFEESNGNTKKVSLSSDKTKILSYIIETLENLEDLILKKSSIVDDVRLTNTYEPDQTVTDIKLLVDSERPSSIPNEIGLFTLFLTHVHYLKSAFKGEIQKSDIDLVKNYVFPREINSIVKENIAKLKAEIETFST